MIGLLAHGLCSPLGPADVAAAAIAAGLSRAARFAPAPLLGAGEDAAPAACHAVLPPDHPDRPAALLRLAWSEMPADLAGSADALLLCLPSADPLRWGPGGPPRPAATASGLCGITRVETLALGHPAPAAALVRAQELMAQGGARRVLLAAVDSLLDPASLAWLAAEDRLRGPETPDGIVPGEAAAWWLLGAASPDALAHVEARCIPGGGARAPQDDADRLQTACADMPGEAWDDGDGEMWRARALGRLDGNARQPAALWGCLGAAGALATGCIAAGGRPAVVRSLGEDGAAGAIRLS